MKKEKVAEILKKLNDRRRKGSKDYYEPLPEDESKIIQEYYTSLIDLPIGGSNIKILNSEDTLISNGYERIVVSDFGAFIEMHPDQIVKENIKSRWPGKPKYKVKYIWYHTDDKVRTKIYWQQDEVEYANYRINYYYMSILDAYAE